MMEGDIPIDGKDHPLGSKPLANVGMPCAKKPISDAPPTAAAAFRNPPIPGTTAANLLKSPAER